MKNSDYWKEHWENRSKLENEISTSGWNSKQVTEYLYTLDDISKKLELRKADELLNIGCGNGLMELVLNYWVSKIDSIDFSKGMIKKAKKNNKNNKNVNFYVGNILDLNFLNDRYDKVLCNGVIQYLNNLEEVAMAVDEIKKISKKRVKILIAANSDKTKFDKFIKGYDKLDMGEEERQRKKGDTKLSLWTYPEEVEKIAKNKGFKAKIIKMDPHVWQSCYMYNILLWR